MNSESVAIANINCDSGQSWRMPHVAWKPSRSVPLRLICTMLLWYSDRDLFNWKTIETTCFAFWASPYHLGPAGEAPNVVGFKVGWTPL